MPTAKTDRGNAAEAAACRYLEKQGLKLIARNYRTRFGEIDLVMRDTEMLVFVEVRFRRNERFGGAAASVDSRKQAKLLKAAADYLANHRCGQIPVRFDIVALHGEPAAINWLRDAFQAAD